jgi:hypothetical protein
MMSPSQRIFLLLSFARPDPAEIHDPTRPDELASGGLWGLASGGQWGWRPAGSG